MAFVGASQNVVQIQLRSTIRNVWPATTWLGLNVHRNNTTKLRFPELARPWRYLSIVKSFNVCQLPHCVLPFVSLVSARALS